MQTLQCQTASNECLPVNRGPSSALGVCWHSKGPCAWTQKSFPGFQIQGYSKIVDTSILPIRERIKKKLGGCAMDGWMNGEGSVWWRDTIYQMKDNTWIRVLSDKCGTNVLIQQWHSSCSYWWLLRVLGTMSCRVTMFSKIDKDLSNEI